MSRSGSMAALGACPELAPEAAAARTDLALRLGEASFGIYMAWVSTEAVLVGVLRVAEPAGAGRVLLMAAGFLATLLSGWLAWRFVEAPAHRWILRRAPPPAPGLGLAAAPQA